MNYGFKLITVVTQDREQVLTLLKQPYTLRQYKDTLPDGIDLQKLKPLGYRLLTLGKDDAQCKLCGLQGNYLCFDVGKGNPQIAHVNVYYKDRFDTVLMTVDHIRPRSKGGGNGQYNLQCLCYPCNLKKGSEYPYQQLGNSNRLSGS